MSRLESYNQMVRTVNHSHVKTQRAETRVKSENRHSGTIKQYLCVKAFHNTYKAFSLFEENSSVRKFLSFVLVGLNKLFTGEI